MPSASLKDALLEKATPPRPASKRKAARGKTPPPAATKTRPGRAGKSNVTGYFDPEVKRQLRVLAARQDTTIQALLGEALNGLFASHGLPEIAPVDQPSK